MNRECIIKGSFWFNELVEAGQGMPATALISDIFDAIESQVCKNCKHYEESEDACYSDKVNPYREIQFHENNPLFGCFIGWEKK